MNRSLLVSILSVVTFISPITAFADGKWGNYRSTPSGSQQWGGNAQGSQPWNNGLGSQRPSGNINRPSTNHGQVSGQQWNSHSSWNQQGQYNNRPNPAWNNNAWNNQNRYTSNGNVYRGNGFNRAPNYGYHNVYRAGDRLPNYYRSSHYYVNDWRGYNLYEPPHGYRWANIDGNFILVAVATGIISQILFGGYYY